MAKNWDDLMFGQPVALQATKVGTGHLEVSS